MPTVLILLSATSAGIIDLRWRRIPNWLVALTIGLSLIWHGATGGLAGLWMSAAGLLVGTAVLLPFFLLRAMGAGDVKFFGALGAAVTYNHVFAVFLISAIVAGLMALIQAVWSRALVATLANVVSLMGRFLRGRFSPHPILNLANDRVLTIPFGVSIAIAAWIFVLFGRR